MRIDRFTQKMQEALQSAQDFAAQYNHAEITNEHFLLSLLGQSDGVVPAILERMGISVSHLNDRLRMELASRPQVQGGSVDIRIGNDLRNVVDAAEREMARLKDEYTSAEHYLL